MNHFIYIDEVTNLRIGEYSENISILYQFDIHILSAYLWWIFLCSNIPAALLYWVFPNSYAMPDHVPIMSIFSILPDNLHIKYWNEYVLPPN